MAEVWEARHPDVASPVALKVMLSHAAASPMLREAFLSEARSHAGLDSPHIVRLLDFGEVDAADAAPDGVSVGDPYLVMELADGTCRDHTLPRRWSELLQILLDVLEGLAYSHARGLIHRDLKPENVLRFGTQYKLADFGIAHSIRALDETADRTTLSVTVGTPHYMAPEQFRGQWYDFGPPTDLYALGIVAYELACGRVPFAQTALLVLVNSHLHDPLPALDPRFGVPSGFEDWVRRLTQKHPDARYQFAADAAHALRDLAAEFADAGLAAEADSSAPAAPTVLLDGGETLIEALSDIITADTLDAVDVGHHTNVGIPHGGASADELPIPAEPAPYTPQWHDESSRVDVGLGLGLLALRDVPVAGHVGLRNDLWAVLGEVSTTPAPRVVVLRGPERAPVNAIVEWFARQAGQTGAARVREVFYTRAGGPREGLVALLEDTFGTWGMTDSEARARIDACVARWVSADVASSCAAIAGGMVLGARGAAAALPATRGERFRVIAELLEATSAGRPYLAAFVDAQWGRDVFGFASRLAERERPGLVVLGVVDTARGQREFGRELEELAALPHVRVFDVRMHAPDEQLEALAHLLPLVESSARRISGVVQGDEVAMRLLLGELAAAGAFRRAAEGYSIADEAPMPSTRAEIFAAAVARCIGGNPSALPALEVAAALGRAPDAAELEDVCGRLGAEAHMLQGLLAEHAIARGVGNRWWFVHDGLVDVVCQTSRARGSWVRVNLACAEALVARVHGEDPAVLERAARHFVAAGEVRRALHPLYRAMRALLKVDVARTSALADEYDELCAQEALAPHDPARVDGSLVRMVLLRAAGDLDGSRTLAEAVVERARGIGHRVAEAFALRHLARLAAARRATAEAIEMLEAAERAALAAGDLREQAACARGLGEVFEATGEFDASVDALVRAVELCRASGDAPDEVAAMSVLASVLAYSGKTDEALRWGEHAMRVAQSAGSAGAAEVSNILGEIARMRADYPRAREHYLDARSRFAFGAPANLHIVDLNLALVDLAAERWQEAEGEFVRLAAEPGTAGLMRLVAIAHAGAAACAAARGDVSALDARLESLSASSQTGLDPDAAHALEAGIRRAANDRVRATLDHFVSEHSRT